MKRKTRSADASGMLVNNLSVADARHILKAEGGELSPMQLASAIASIVFISGMTARAIWIGDATAWHLTLPMAVEYLVLLLFLPAIYLVIRHPAMKKDALGAVRLLAILAIVLLASLYQRASAAQTGLREQIAMDAKSLVDWVVGAHMHWPILAAAAGSAIAIPGRVRNLFLHGPPFVGVSLGCAMRFVVLIFGVALLPFIVGNWKSISPHAVWIFWGIILAGDGLALWMHWDIQQRLKRRDDSTSANAELPP